MAQRSQSYADMSVLLAPEYDGDLAGLLALLACIALQRARRLAGHDSSVVESDDTPEQELANAQRRAA